ncbi:hypothetical protein BDR07DRAFT_1522517 [Suillus spraguei]|nr:hypothetical protein BDR07DRAFT_1522517 [Suillus spraguei]
MVQSLRGYRNWNMCGTTSRNVIALFFVPITTSLYQCFCSHLEYHLAGSSTVCRWSALSSSVALFVQLHKAEIKASQVPTYLSWPPADSASALSPPSSHPTDCGHQYLPRCAPNQVTQQFSLTPRLSLITQNFDAFSHPVARTNLLLGGILEEPKRPDIIFSKKSRPTSAPLSCNLKVREAFLVTNAEDQMGSREGRSSYLVTFPQPQPGVSSKFISILLGTRSPTVPSRWRSLPTFCASLDAVAASRIMLSSTRTDLWMRGSRKKRPDGATWGSGGGTT